MILSDSKVGWLHKEVQMQLHSLSNLIYYLRIAAIVLAIVVVTSCNMSTPTSTVDEGVDTSGPYAANQQAMEGENDGQALTAEPWENYAGCTIGEKWYVCVTVHLTTTWPNPLGQITYSVKPGTIPCAEVMLITSQDVEWGEVIDIDISGESENDDWKLTWKGQTTMIVLGTARCVGGEAKGWEQLTFDQKWGNASAKLTCTPKHDGVNCIPNSTIPLGTLGDQSMEITLELKTGNESKCQTFPVSGPISGELRYCLYPVPAIEPIPLVP
jgi:hypothetical protein